MGSYREFETGVQFGNTYFKLFKFVVNEISKDAYIVLPIPDVGLKLSIHSPKPPIFPTLHAHWRSHKLDIHEDVDIGNFSENSLLELGMEYLESLRYFRPLGNEKVMVFPNFLTTALQKQLVGKRERTIIDVGKLMRRFSGITFYQTKANKMPFLIRDLKRKNPALDLSNDFGIWAISENNRIIIPLSSKTMIEFDHQTLMKKIGGIGSNSLFSPVEKAIETISRTNPNAFQKWVPTSDLEDFSKKMIKNFKQSEPKIVTY